MKINDIKKERTLGERADMELAKFLAIPGLFFSTIMFILTPFWYGFNNTPEKTYFIIYLLYFLIWFLIFRYLKGVWNKL